MREKTGSMPKALVEIGGIPVVRHVIEIYLRSGFDRILLATGYRGEMIGEFVEREEWPDGVTVEAVGTGENTPTGGRIHALRDRLGEATFCVTYADGLANIDLDSLLGFHAAHGGEATVTAVQPQLPWGVAEIDGDGRVRGFTEKPQAQQWVNGGFFCFEPGFLARLDEDAVLEREPLESAAREGSLFAFRHLGFWDCMDTYKDAVTLNDLWNSGEVPWLEAAGSAVGR